MGHEWVFDVLEDLKSYAVANNLHQLAAKADEAIKVATAEISAQEAAPVLIRPKGMAPH